MFSSLVKYPERPTTHAVLFFVSTCSRSSCPLSWLIAVYNVKGDLGGFPESTDQDRFHHLLISGMNIKTQASLLTEKDMARIAERERRERQEEHATDSQEKTANNEVIVSQSDLSAANVQSDAQGNSLQRNSTDGNVGGITGSDPPPRTSSDDGSLGVGVAVVSNGQGESSLLGVPVAVGPNVTKFLYVNVPRKGEAAANESGATQFDAEEAASGLCTELHGQVAVAGGNEEAETCLASLSTALASRCAAGNTFASAC